MICTHVLDLDDYYNFFGDRKWKLIKGSVMVARGRLSHALYKTQVKTIKCTLNASKDDTLPDLWCMSLNLCDDYLYEKQHKISFNNSSKRKKNVFELAYFDVYGFIDVEILGGNRYFVTFIYDVSRKVWVFILKTKNHVLQYFK